MNAPNSNKEDRFFQKIEEKEKRKLKALREKKRSVWFGLGMFGLVGWTIAVPALLGAAIGIWLDKRYPETFSWTLSLLVSGLIIGCFAAWNWVAKEDKEIHQNEQEENE